jgi:hypothetical protein
MDDITCQACAIETANGRVSSLVTRLRTAEMTLGQAMPLLDPANWPHCSELWLAMDPLPPSRPGGHRRYLEVIGQQSGAAAGWRLRTCLDFVVRRRPDGTAALGYRLSADQSEADGVVMVDEGGIYLDEHCGQLRVSTVKRLRLAFPALPGDMAAGIAAALRAFGYATVGKRMLLAAARLAGAPPPAPDPVRPLPDSRQVSSGIGRRPVGALVDDLVGAAVTALSEQTVRFGQVAGLIAQGRYSAGHLVQDGAGALADSLRFFTGAADAVVRAAANTRPGGLGTRTVSSDRFRFSGDAYPIILEPLVGDFGDEIPTSDVRIVPCDENSFRLAVTVGPERTGSYWGEVRARTETVPVEVLIP